MKIKTSKFLLGLLSVTFLTSSIFAAEGGRRKKRKATDKLSGQPALKKRRTRQTVKKLQDDFNAACATGNLDTVKNLLDRIDLNGVYTVTGEGIPMDSSYLYTACMYGQKEVVEFLLEKDIDPYRGLITRDQGEEVILTTPLMGSVLIESIDIVELLLNSNKIKDINWGGRDQYGGTGTPFSMACAKGNKAIVKLFLNHKNAKKAINTKIICADFKERTPLATACFYEQEEIVKMLLESGLVKDVNDGESHNNQVLMTPLYAACLNENKNIVKLLLNHPQVEARKVCAEGKTAYSVANDEIKELINSHIIEKDEQCGVCKEMFLNRQKLHLSRCCHKFIHVSCAVEVASSEYNKCIYCNGPSTPLNTFEYIAKTFEAGTQTESEPEQTSWGQWLRNIFSF